MAFACRAPTVAMATKKVVKKKTKTNTAKKTQDNRAPAQIGIAPETPTDEYQGYVFGYYPEWGTFPGSGDPAFGIPFDEEKNAEREVIHGRFAMLGVTGAWAQENLGEGPWFSAGSECTPQACKISYLGQEAFGETPGAFWVLLIVEALTFGYAEALRTGLADTPEYYSGLDSLYPGGPFDPLNNLGQGNVEELKLKELKHCRLAMTAWLGLIAQGFATNPNGPSDGVGPVANWSAHVADPFNVNVLSVFANR